jgi:simple sugar transport system permease protein
MLFAFFDAMQLRLQQADAGAVPHQARLMLPYVLSIVAPSRSRAARIPRRRSRSRVKGDR